MAGVSDRQGHDPDDSRSVVLDGLMRDRFSCRSFLPRPVAPETIDKMLGMAQRAPSWCNSQPWEVHLTSGAATERFRSGLYSYAMSGAPMEPDLAFPTAYQGVYRDRQRECGWQLYESVGVTRGDRLASSRQAMENFRLYGAPHVLLLTSERELGTYGAVDCGIYAGVMLLAAQSLGLAAIAQGAIAGCAPFVRTFFELPENRVILLGMSLGYADEGHPANGFRTKRAALDRVVHRIDE